MSHFDVIVVSTEPPDPFGNAAGRWYYVLAKGLCERGHRVRWLAAYSREASAARARAYLKGSGVNLRLYPYPARSWLRSKWETLRRPYGYFVSRSLAQDLTAELERGYDVAHFEPTWAAWLGLGVPRALLSIQWLAQLDLARTVPQPFRLLMTGALMKRTERQLIGQFDTIRALTPQDSRIVQRLNPRARLVTIPLAIDPTLYPFEAVEPAHPTVGLIGSMNWQPTRSAAVRLLTSIWPKVKASVRDATLLVVGWGARRALGQFLDRPDVTIIEDVPDSAPYFRQLSLLAFPVSNGSGMKVKVLEAMAYGVPTVTTRDGIAGIEAADGYQAAISDDDAVFADKIIELLKSEAARRAMTLAARRLIEERYSPAAVLPQIEALYQEVV